MTMRVPTSTYRLQVNARFTLQDAAATLPYLHDLGVDWVYLSPLLRAEPGSDHGYDVVDTSMVDPDRGGAEGLAAVSAEAKRLGMGVLVDIVPNHMGVATPRENAWWWDLLRHGRASAHADAFDVDWDAGGGRIRIPVLGDDGLDAVLVDDSEGVARYHDHVFPLAPGTTALAEQHYELVHWTVADHGLNYRRFFAVNTLAGVRVEDRAVFADSHAEIRRWFDEGLVDGLRVDHPDGLRDPAAYLDDVRDLTGGAYVLVEKILEPGESPARVLGHGRDHRVRRPRPRRPRPHRPRWTGSLDRSGDASPRDAARLPRAGPRHQARRRRRHPGLRDPPRRARGDGVRVPAGRGGRSATVTRPRGPPRRPCPGRGFRWFRDRR